MNKEEKELLLKDLCARLPYGVILSVTLKDKYDDIVNRNIELTEYNLGYITKAPNWQEYKPYLRPMSSMNEKEKQEFSIFTGKTEVYVQQICLDADSMANPIIGGNKCVYWGLFDKCIDWLNEHYFDYRGLIGKGLAIEAPEGMYDN